MSGIAGTMAGPVRGREEGGIWSFLGIPYAASPEGARRWRPPEPPVPWAGIRDAFSPGLLSPQAPPSPLTKIPGDPSAMGEDCCNLNVWTPSPDGAGRPVLVWFHGGGFTSGTGASLLYRGDNLARRGNVVVVTANYRLGALGFLAHPSLTDSATGAWANWGLLDQLEALAWVRDNVAAFGGDPGNVTVFGESAGAMSVALLIDSPGAAGLFQKAIVQSGPPIAALPEEAVSTAESFARLLGLPRIDRHSLEKVPAGELVAAQQALGRERRGQLGLPLLPVVDAILVCRSPAEVLFGIEQHLGASLQGVSLRGRQGEPVNADQDARVAGSFPGRGAQLAAPPAYTAAQGRTLFRGPLIAGTNRDEMTFFAFGNQKRQEVDEDRLVENVATMLARISAIASGREPGNEAVDRCDGSEGVGDRDAAREMIAVYREARGARGQPADPLSLWVAIVSDGVFRIPTIALLDGWASRGNRAYGYLFTKESPLVGGPLGACHALEIPFVFGSYRNPAVALFSGSGPAVEMLSASMQEAWLAFARHGDPSCEALGQWPAYDGSRPTMILGDSCHVEEDALGAERRAWESLHILDAS